MNWAVRSGRQMVACLLIASTLFPFLFQSEAMNVQGQTTITVSRTVTVVQTTTAQSTATSELYSGSISIPDPNWFLPPSNGWVYPPGTMCSVYHVSYHVKVGDELLATITLSERTHVAIMPSIIFEGMIASMGTTVLPPIASCPRSPVVTSTSLVIPESTFSEWLGPETYSLRMKVQNPPTNSPQSTSYHFVFSAPKESRVSLSLKAISTSAVTVTQTELIVNATTRVEATSLPEFVIIGVLSGGAVAAAIVLRHRRRPRSGGAA